MIKTSHRFKAEFNPPVPSVDQALSYRSRRLELDPQTTLLMTLYLSPEVTPSVIADAAKTGMIAGVKSYLKGWPQTPMSDYSTAQPSTPCFRQWKNTTLS
jgi:dihydroorotase